MQIKNQTNRTLEIHVASHTSQTLWTTEVAAGTSQGKDLPSSDAPYTATGRWKSDPPTQYNFLLGSTANVPKNDSVVTITQAYPGFTSYL